MEELTPDGITLTLVNVNQIEPRSVIIQAGGYAAHQFASVSTADRTLAVEARELAVNLAPGTGSRLKMMMKRYVNQPTMLFPWDRERSGKP